MADKKFCIICGAPGKEGAKFCPKCGSSMAQHDDELKEYLINKAKGKAKGKAKSTLREAGFTRLEKFINSKAYGIVLSLTVVANAGMIIAGGSSGPKINEFSNDTPGVFVNGYSFNMPAVPQEPENIEYDQSSILQQGGFAVYPVRNENYDITALYFKSTVHSGDKGGSLKVTGSDGSTLSMQNLVYNRNVPSADYHSRSDYTFYTEDLTCSMLYEFEQYGDKIKIEAQMGGNAGVMSQKYYKNDKLITHSDYYENGCTSYELYTGQEFEGNEVYKKFSEVTFNTDSLITSRRSYIFPEGNPVELREERVYEGNITKITIYRDNIIHQYTEKAFINGADRVTQNIDYENGIFKSKVEYGYDDMGNMVLHAGYEDIEDVPTFRDETIYFADNPGVKMEVRRYGHKDSFDENGNLVSRKSVISSIVIYHENGQIKEEIKYDENGYETYHAKYDRNGNSL